MPHPPPPTLLALLSADDAEARARAWTAFLDEHSALVLHVARSLGGDDDAAMDRYAFVLDALQRDDHRRLRAFASDGRGRFTTWLFAVVRRLCVDEYRHRYGRPQGAADAAGWRARRELVDLVGDADALDQLEATDASPDLAVQRREVRESLGHALDALDPSDRLLLRLRLEDGLGMPEIARLVGEDSPFRLYRRIERLRRTLREALQAAGIEPPR